MRFTTVLACLALLWMAPAALGNDPLHGQSVTIEQIRPHVFETRFEFAHPGAKTVAVVGDFNQWEPSQFPLTLDPTLGKWRGSLELQGGEYRYKFVVNGTQWIADAANPLKEPDGFGGENSLLRLGAMARVRESRARVGDNRIQDDALIHAETFPLYFRVLDNGRVLVRVIALANDAAKVDLLRPTSSNPNLAAARPEELNWGAYPMKRVQSDRRFDYWETEVVPDKGNILVYAFAAEDGAARILLDASGALPAGTAKPTQPFSRRFDEREIFRAPAWAKDVIWYHVIVDRWRDGSPDNNPPQTRPWTARWQDASSWEGRDGQTFYNGYVFERVYGGDLQGIETRLTYLQKLGVTGLYLSPVFASQSFHGYDVIDYRHVEDRLAIRGESQAAQANEDLLDSSTWTWTASDRLFLDFLALCRSRGFRVVLDVPFNHSGNEHPAFRDIKAKGRESSFRNWYEITSWEPFEYKGWGGFGKLPLYKEDRYGFVDSRLQRHIFDITRRWMDPNGDGNPSDGIDGWRLDSAKEVSQAFWSDWREHVKSINPDALIVGEVWEQPGPYLSGSMFDATTNYQLAIRSAEFFFDDRRAIKPSEFDSALAELRMAAPRQALESMFNQIDSHDTDRVLSMIINPDRPYDRRNQVQGDGPSYNDSKPPLAAVEKLKFYLAFQMTYIGAPVIYYGSEVGMHGADDPNNRQPMWWEDLQYADPDIQINTSLLDYYTRLLAIRNRWDCFRSGSYKTLLADDRADVFAFGRQGQTEAAVVILNRSTSARVVALNVAELRDEHGSVQQWTDVLRERDYRIVNFRRPNETVTRRGIRIDKAYPIRARPDGNIEVALGPREAAILISGAGQ